MRSHWIGTLNVALMAIPLSLYKATDQPHNFAFNLLHVKGKDGKDICGQIGNQNVCKACEAEVSKDAGNLGRGYQYEPGKFVLVTDDEVNSVKLPTDKQIQVIGFVSADEIEPAYYEEVYYAGTNAGGERGFALLREGLTKKKKVAIGRVTMRSREDFVAIRPYGTALMVQVLRYKHEVRPISKMPVGTDIAVSSREINMFAQLIDGMTTTFGEIDTPDRYSDAMGAMIEQKRLGKKIAATASPGPRTVTGTIEALKKSLAATAKSKKGAQKSVKPAKVRDIKRGRQAA